MRYLGLSMAAAAALLPVTAQAQSRPDQQAFFGLYKELVETNTTLSVGDCTKAAQQIAVRLKAAGYPDKDVTIFTPPGHPREGGLVAVLPGSDPAVKPMLLLAHVDPCGVKGWGRLFSDETLMRERDV